MRTDSATRYGAAPCAADPSPSVRLPQELDRVCDRLSRMGWGSPKHVRGRLAEQADFTTDALRAMHDSGLRREDWRRRQLVALSDEPAIPLTDDLLARLIRVDADGDAALGQALIGGITPAEARAILPRLRPKFVVLQDALRALEALAQEDK